MFRTIISIILWPVALLVFLLFVAIFLLLRLFIKPIPLFPYVRFACRMMMLAAGQWLRIEGNLPDKKGQPYLYLFNHESMFDPFMFAGSVKHYITGVGANYQFSYPVWGFLIKRYGAIPIKRKELDEAIHSLDIAEESIHNGISFIISPEGTRTVSGQMGPFKKGPFHVALKTGVTIVPVALMGAYEAKKKTDWKLNPGILTIRFGDPISGEQYKNMDLDSLRNVIRSKITDLINQSKSRK